MIYQDYLFKDRLPLMTKALDAYSARQKTIAKNIANVGTPNYTPEKVRFEELFNNEKLALSGTRDNENHLALGADTKESLENQTVKQDIPQPEMYYSGDSNVNIDKEMSELAINQIKFRFASSMTRRYFDGLDSAIKGVTSGR